MKSENLKHEIHGYIEQADEATLQAIRTLIKPGFDQVQLTKQQQTELEKRRKNHLSGKTKSYTWQQAEQMIKIRKK